MAGRIAAFIIGEGNWLPLAMAIALAATGARWFTAGGASSRQRTLAAMNLFTGVMLFVMGCGHLLAVFTRQWQGTLRGSAVLFYAIGIAIVTPAALLIRQTKAILATDHALRTARLHFWMAATLAVLGLVNLPLAVPALCTIAYSLHRRRWAAWASVTIFVIACAGLFIGGVIFMASGQTFEEFSNSR
jgi:hypothetical protein